MAEKEGFCFQMWNFMYFPKKNSNNRLIKKN